ncbi:rhamnose-binding lectin-like, partial [Clarias magur]
YRRIRIISAFYGRTDSTTCATGCRRRQLRNRSCYSRNARSIVRSRCNGLRECELKTDLLGNPDPCIGTYKYYSTAYECING